MQQMLVPALFTSSRVYRLIWICIIMHKDLKIQWEVMSILFVFVCTWACTLLLSHIQLFASLPDCSTPGCSVYGISQPRILEWVAISSSKGSTWPKYQICISCIGRQVLNHKCHLGGPNDYTVYQYKHINSMHKCMYKYMWTYWKILYSFIYQIFINNYLSMFIMSSISF